FLALARRDAGGWRDSLAGWLHEVAWRTSTKLKVANARRRAREARAARDLAASPGAEPGLATALDEELLRLPAGCRDALVLCYFEAVPRSEAARQLGLSLRTLDRRLDEGRGVLRDRLERRGATLEALLAGPSPLPAELVAGAVRGFPTRVFALAPGKGTL